MLKTYLRHIFEHKSLKKVFGTNLALMVVLGSFVPNTTPPIEAETLVIKETNAPITTQKTVQYPILGNYLATQGFSLFHPGIDMATSLGTDIYPIKDGVVEAVSYSRYAYGNAIIVNHENEVSSLYAHLSEITVNEGQKVTTLTKIGEVGSTGRSTGPHLHLEIRNRGIPINPYVILPSSASSIY